jgi:protease IV
MGMADAFGSADYVAREVFKAEDIVDFTIQEGIAERFAKRLGTSVSNSINPLAQGGAGVSLK